MPNVPGLRSIYQKTGRIVYFGRMLDKIRLHHENRLPQDYISSLQGGFDARCCDFLQIQYPSLVKRTLEGGTDEEILAWAEAHGATHSDQECEVWNGFMMKRGWRDSLTPRLQEVIAEAGLESKPIETMFDFIEFDEGRDPVAKQSWKL